MTRAQYSAAEPAVEKIRNLETLKNSFGYPAECYHIEFGTVSGNGVIANTSDIDAAGMKIMIDQFKAICEAKIARLEKELEEI